MAHQLDYSPLNEPVTRADMTAYKQSGLYKGFPVMNILGAIGVIILLVFMLPYAIAVIQSTSFSLNTVMPLIAIGVLVSIFWELFKNTAKRRAKLYKFALRNNLTLVVDVSNPAYAGMIFDNGHSREINDAVRFGDGTEIGNYTYVTGSGKNQRTYTRAYAKIRLARRLPHMVLDAKGNNFWKFSSLSDTFDRSQTLALEGDFNNYFTLYAPKQYERDALYVFTPDVMAAMIDHGKDYDIEIIDDELFIYANKHFKLDQPETYERILTIASTVARKLINQTDYYADERIGSHAANIVAPQGQRLKSGFNWMIVIFIVIIVYFNIIQPLIFRLMQ